MLLIRRRSGRQCDYVVIVVDVTGVAAMQLTTLLFALVVIVVDVTGVGRNTQVATGVGRNTQVAVNTLIVT